MAGEPDGPVAAGSAGRRMRADARSNRARILDVAEEVFAKGGDSASTEEVARLAGVGIATVFRHFPTKADLLEAVLVERLQRLCSRAQAMAESVDPGEAFFDFFAHAVADSKGKIAIAESLIEAGGNTGGMTAQASEDLRRAVGLLLERAQEAGAVRDDVDLMEVFALLVGTSRATALGPSDRELQARVLAIVFDGLTPRQGGR